MFTGPITSNDLTNVTCGRGTLTFPDSEELRTLFSGTQPETTGAAYVHAERPEPQVDVPTSEVPEQPAVKTSKPIQVVYDTIPRPTIPAKSSVAPVTVKVTAGVEQMYEWNSDTIKLEIWDGGKIDGDLVTVYYNGEMVWDRSAISATKKRFYLPLSASDDINRIVIVAINEGNEPPNTANLTLWDGPVSHAVIAYNSIGKEAVIKVRRKK
jgi:hypothetical protein